MELIVFPARVERLIDLCRNLEKTNALILMGSFADKKAEIGSDVDLLVLTDNVENCMNSINQKLGEIFTNDEILMKPTIDEKLIVYLRNKFLKIDLNFATKINEKERYLRGSESAVVIFDKTSSQKLKSDLESLMKTKAHESLNDYSEQYHTNRFLEMFELGCKSVYRCDVYRAEFYVFLLRHSLITLEIISTGEKTHLYLPQNAYQHCPLMVGGEPLKSLQFTSKMEQFQLFEIYGQLFVALQRKIEKNDVQIFQNFFQEILKNYSENENDVSSVE